MHPFLIDDLVTYQPSKGYLLWMMKPLSDIHPLGTTFLIRLTDSSKWELESITELHMAPWVFWPFLNSTRLSIGGAWCGLFNTFWEIIYNNWVCVIKACSIDGGLGGGGLELAGFLRSSYEALLLVATICFQHVWIRTQSFITSLIVASRDDKIGLMAIETREDQTPEITDTSKWSARM